MGGQIAVVAERGPSRNLREHPSVSSFKRCRLMPNPGSSASLADPEDGGLQEPLIKARREHNEAEPKLSSASFGLSLEKTPHA